MVKNGDESHGTIRKISPQKQIQNDSVNIPYQPDGFFIIHNITG